MKRILLAAVVMMPIAAYAQQPPAQPQKPDVVLIPRDVGNAVVQLANAIATLDPKYVTPAMQAAFSTLDACLKNNPVNGGLPPRIGPDQCPSVTEALDARTKEIADLHAKIAELQGKLGATGQTVPVKP